MIKKGEFIIFNVIDFFIRAERIGFKTDDVSKGGIGYYLENSTERRIAIISDRKKGVGIKA